MAPRGKSLGSSATAATDENPFLTSRHIDNLAERTAAHTAATARSELATNRLTAACDRVEVSNNRLAELLGRLLAHLEPPQPQQPSGDDVAPKET